MTGALRRVLVRPPLPEDVAHWREYGWRAAPDYSAAAAEHDILRGLLEGAGAEVVVSRHDPGNPDAIYVYDPVLVGADGAVLLRPGKRGRRSEPRVSDERRGCSRTRGGVSGRDDRPFRSLSLNGTGEVMHLMTFISPLDRDLAVVYPRIAPGRLLRLLAERGIAVVEVPDEEFESQGSNVLALGPRRALALAGNPETRRRMEKAGVEVTVYRGDEISKKGDGGPTCLTRPLLRI